MHNLAPRPSNLVAEYTGAPAGRDYDFWREDVCRNFCRVDAEPSAGSQIFCKIEIARVGSLALARTCGKSGRFLRTRDLLSDSCDDFILFGATSGTVLVVRERRAVEVALVRHARLVRREPERACRRGRRGGGRARERRVHRRRVDRGLCNPP